VSKVISPVDELIRFAKTVVQQAGEQALSFYGKGAPTLKFDSDLLTKAEIQLTRFFENQLQSTFPEHQLFQSTHADHGYTHGEKRYLWIFDPINGSANFQSGIPIWGVSVALLENFWPILGVFYMPVTGDLFHACAGAKAFHGNRPIQVRGHDTLNDESLLFVFSRFHQQFRCSFPGKIRDLGCTGAHFCYVAMGRGEAVVAANESFRDLAGLRVILEAAGGKIFNLDGSGFFLNDYLDGHSIDGGILACSPDTATQIKEYLISG
jgi:myo-inositol-1(or 4)-monophosphatase